MISWFVQYCQGNNHLRNYVLTIERAMADDGYLISMRIEKSVEQHSYHRQK